MKLSLQLPIFTSVTILISIIIISIFVLSIMTQFSEDNINEFEKVQMQLVKENIKDMVDISYNMIADSYSSSQPSMIEKKYGIDLKNSGNDELKMVVVNVLKITLENIRTLRFGKDGYVWINKFESPYTIILHPGKPEIEGTAQTFLVGDNNENIYAIFADICAENGGGFFQYDYYELGSNRKLPKLSYIRYFEPLDWVIGTGTYIDQIQKEVENRKENARNRIRLLIWITIIISIVLILSSGGFLYLVLRKINQSISFISKQLNDLALGKQITSIKVRRKDELGDIQHSLAAVVDGVNKYIIFSKKIGQGELKTSFSPLSKEDVLGNSLLEMRKSLDIAKQEEINRGEEIVRRNWINEGQAKFSELLRKNSNNIDSLAFDIISNLISYMDANQGGLFVKETDEQGIDFLQLRASYAYNRQRFHKKRVEMGDGLIGACALEKKTIYITSLPDNYIEITSGLGTANPKCLLILPLKIEDQFFGIIEIASFRYFEDYEIKFAERLSQNTASTIQAVIISEKNTKLLAQFEAQAKEKELQEIEFILQLEELQQLKEQIAKKEKEEEDEDDSESSDS